MNLYELSALAYTHDGELNIGDKSYPVRIHTIDNNPLEGTTLKCAVLDWGQPWPKSNPNIKSSPYTIKKVIFNDPATIVYWADGTKTVVKAQPEDKYDREKGFAMAIAKKALGNKGNYNETFKKWKAVEEKTTPETSKIIRRSGRYPWGHIGPESRCIVCGEIIPEGRLVCPMCEQA